MLDLPPPIWLPPKPAIIRPAEPRLLAPGYLPATPAERRAAIADLIRRGLLSKRDAANALVIKLPPALAMLMVNQLIGFGAGGAEPLVLTYIGSNSSTTDAQVYDFGNFSAATAGLMIVIGISSGTAAGGNATMSDISIGGSSGTIHVNPSGGRVPSAVASRVVSAGNNNVTVTTSAVNQQECSCHVWLLTGYTSATPADTDGAVAALSGTVTLTLDIPAGGIAVYAASKQNTATIGWSSADERYDATSGSSRFGAADKSTVGALSAHAETATWSGSGNWRGGCGASWG